MSEETKEIGEIQKMVKQSKNVGTVRERDCPTIERNKTTKNR